MAFYELLETIGYGPMDRSVDRGNWYRGRCFVFSAVRRYGSMGAFVREFAVFYTRRESDEDSKN